MAKRTPAKPQLATISFAVGDFGPMMADPADGRRQVPVMSQHGDVDVKKYHGGRRAYRIAMHDRLLERGKITDLEHDSVERFVKDWSFIARSGLGSTLGQLDVRGSSDGPADTVLIASTKVRLATGRVGAWRFPILIDACCEGMNGSAMARKYLGSDSGGARDGIEKLAVEAIQLLHGAKLKLPVDE
ncbi:hypothetical protein ACELLULO517_07695 [Acidisoma cellulosilytica]|uniref:Uncharacterized protein n=1 Tax=Acidisoma cellulosilyticum TaxID=2802395 RepID=A0A963YZU7_9PROT|nr:hypothetical protein [Acidisoma cellulosilyticum]MCB8880114.1 hypothetical protein [Acidisoma cellulosilyticum]